MMTVPKNPTRIYLGIIEMLRYQSYYEYRDNNLKNILILHPSKTLRSYA